jgi:hypothetical protein
MRFTLAVAGAFATLAVAQSPSASESQAPTTTYALTPAQSSLAACLKQCKPGDVECESPCINVPNPGEQAVNDTTKCVADCDKFKGKGTESDIEKYTQCRNKCIDDNFHNPNGSNSGSSPAQTTASNGESQTSGAAKPIESGSESGSGSDDEASSTTSDSPSGTAGNADEPTESPGAASALAVSSFAVFGALAAAFAL